MRRVSAAALALLALLATACPPPPDFRADGRASPASRERPAEAGPAAATPDASVPTPPPREDAGSAPGSAAFPAPSDTPRPVVYEVLAGGVRAPRCPSCGEVQGVGVERCPGCRQVLAPWRHETTCTSCGGEGRCDRCGDDRVCLVCEGDGRCVACGGRRADGSGPCGECGGGGDCEACRGDGVRESAEGDFLPDESFLPGVCPTCVDGSGLCPECGSLAKDAAGRDCATCAGRGVCPDCAGLGTCPHCAGDGLCTDCAGGGRIVLNGAPRRAAERARAIRAASGVVHAPAVVTERPTDRLALARVEGGATATTSLLRADVHPLAWWLAVRDFPPREDGRNTVEASQRADHEMTLASLAAEARYWPLAEGALRRARSLDPRRGTDIDARMREYESARFHDWIQRSDAALQSGDILRSMRLLGMASFQGRGTSEGKRAETALLVARKAREDSNAQADEAVRRLAAEQVQPAATRAAATWKARMDRAQSLLSRADGLPPTDPLRERTFERADVAAWSAQRLVAQAAFREPVPDAATWPQAPADLLRQAREFQAGVARSRAQRAVEGGRFALAERLAKRALAVDALDEVAKRVLNEARLGLARRGVLEGSPPPENR